MDEFSDGIRGLINEKPAKFPEDCLSNLESADMLGKDVTIALADDGVDFMHPAVSAQMSYGKSFDSGIGNEIAGAPEAFHGSTTRHGTTMAYMIGRVCPDVKIFVCKLDVLRRGDGEKANFTAKSAADVVSYAVNRRFDIICMSWSIQKSEENTKYLNRLVQALQAAASHNILLFCSAPDRCFEPAEHLSSF